MNTFYLYLKMLCQMMCLLPTERVIQPEVLIYGQGFYRMLN